MLLSLFAIMLFFQIVTDGTLLQPLNLTNLVLQNSYIVIMALGMLLVIVTGHIDLSVGSVAGFIGAVAAVLMVTLSGRLSRSPSSHACWSARPSARRKATGSPISASPPSSSRWPACWCSRVCARAAAGPVDRTVSATFQKLSSGFIPELLPGAGRCIQPRCCSAPC